MDEATCNGYRANVKPGGYTLIHYCYGDFFTP
jgi:hypothetical protein